MNGKITAKNTNIYKVLDVVQAEEMIANTSFEILANLGQFKRKDNAQLLNLQTINNLVLQYRFGEIQPFGFLNGYI